MPEGPEVLILAHYLTTKTQTKFITEIVSNNKPNLKYNLKADLKFPLKINKISSKGKMLWFETTDKNNEDIYIISTFGLTGFWSFNCFDSVSTRMTLKIFNNKSKNSHDLCFNDNMKFGTVVVTDDKTILKKRIDTLAPDYIQTEQSFSEFKRAFDNVRNKKQKIVQMLMEQNIKKTTGSGIGNYLVCEILYNAKISPYRLLDSLTDNDLKVLYNSIHELLRMSYYNNETHYWIDNDFIDRHRKLINSGKFSNYLNKFKTNKFVFNVYKKKTDKFNNNVKVDKIISGRSTYWVEEIQK